MPASLVYGDLERAGQGVRIEFSYLCETASGLTGWTNLTDIDEDTSAVSTGDPRVCIHIGVQLPCLGLIRRNIKRQLRCLAHQGVDLSEQTHDPLIDGADSSLQRAEVHSLAKHCDIRWQLNVGQQLRRLDSALREP